MNFQSAAGSIVGAAHLRAGRNGQDGFAILRGDECTIAVVTDGCGSSPHSEVGAKLGAHIVARALLEGTASRITDSLREIARSFDDDIDRAIRDYFLFTIVAAVITPDQTTILSAGDGLFSINGDTTTLGPFDGNAPPYLAYGDVPLEVHASVPTADVDTLLLATDGASRITDGLQTFWTDERVFHNPDALRRKLFVLTRPGRATLDDDTTIVVLRRVP